MNWSFIVHRGFIVPVRLVTVGPVLLKAASQILNQSCHNITKVYSCEYELGKVSYFWHCDPYKVTLQALLTEGQVSKQD